MKRIGIKILQYNNYNNKMRKFVAYKVKAYHIMKAIQTIKYKKCNSF